MKNALKFALLTSSALFAASAWAQEQPTPPEHYTLDQRGVDLVSGQFSTHANDVVIGDPAKGGIVFGRVWTNGGWRDTLSGTVSVDGNVYIVSLGGVSEVFIKSGTTFTPSSNRGATLTQSGTLITLTTSDGTKAEYSTIYNGSTSPYMANNAALMAVRYTNGKVLNYHWNGITYCSLRERPTLGSGEDEGGIGECLVWANAVRPEAITNNYGYMVKYLYASDDVPIDGRALRSGWLNRTGVMGVNQAVDSCPIVGPCSGTTQTWPSVAYTRESMRPGGLLLGSIVSVTDSTGQTTNYDYSSGGLSSISYPGAISPDISIAYDSGKVSSISSASGTWNYSYADSGTTRTTTATGPLGQSQTAVSDQTIGRATSVTEVVSTAPAVSRTTSYEYDAQRRLQKIINPEGDYTQLTYDTRGNVTQQLAVAQPGSGLANIITSAAYPATCSNPVTCNQPTSTTDALGRTTNYTYDSVHGGVLTVTAPAPSTGAARPQTRVTYAAQTARYKTPSGALTNGTPIILPVSSSVCITGSSCAGTVNEVKTDITYGPATGANNLLPTVVSNGAGDGSLTSTTTLTYTPHGDVSTVDGPMAGTADTTTYRYDNARQMVGIVGPDPDGSGPLHHRAQRLSYNPRGQAYLVEQGTVAGTSDAHWAAFASLQQ